MTNNNKKKDRVNNKRLYFAQKHNFVGGNEWRCHG